MNGTAQSLSGTVTSRDRDPRSTDSDGLRMHSLRPGPEDPCNDTTRVHDPCNHFTHHFHLCAHIAVPCRAVRERHGAAGRTLLTWQPPRSATSATCLLPRACVRVRPPLTPRPPAAPAPPLHLLTRRLVAARFPPPAKGWTRFAYGRPSSPCGPARPAREVSELLPLAAHRDRTWPAGFSSIELDILVRRINRVL